MIVSIVCMIAACISSFWLFYRFFIRSRLFDNHIMQAYEKKMPKHFVHCKISNGWLEFQASKWNFFFFFIWFNSMSVGWFSYFSIFPSSKFLLVFTSFNWLDWMNVRRLNRMHINDDSVWFHCQFRHIIIAFRMNRWWWVKLHFTSVLQICNSAFRWWFSIIQCACINGQ